MLIIVVVISGNVILWLILYLVKQEAGTLLMRYRGNELLGFYGNTILIALEYASLVLINI